MIDFVEIAQSWFRVGKHTEEQKLIAEERTKICDGCDQKSYDAFRVYFKCNACGCPLQAKVYSPRGPDACPLKKWPR